MNKQHGQLYYKARALIKRKHERIREFQNLILEDQYMNIICMIDEQEENLYDVKLFSTLEEYETYEETVIEEIREIGEFKTRIMNDYECKISVYTDYTDEEAVIELEDFIEE